MATSPGSGWASGPWSSGKHRGGNGVWRFPITLSERGAHRGVVEGDRRVAGGSTRCSARDDARVSIDRPRSQAHKHDERAGTHDVGRAGRRRRPRGRRGRATGSPRPGTGCSWSRRSSSRARRPAATASRRGPSASSTTWASPASSRARSATTGCARSRTASRSSCEWPDAPRLPRLRLRGAPPRPRPDGGRRGRRRRRRGVDRRRGRRAAGRRRPGHRRGRSGATASTKPVRARYVVVADGANSRFGRALGTRPRPHATRWAWRCGATSPARSTTSPGSRATSTCATATATTCPATAGSSRWATAP